MDSHTRDPAPVDARSWSSPQAQGSEGAVA